MHFGHCRSRLCDHFNVEPFVDHAEEAYSRVRYVCLVYRVIAGLSCLVEMRNVYAAGEGKNRLVEASFGLVQTLPAREHDISALEQRFFHLLQLCRRVLEGGEFIHAVVDAYIAGYMVTETQRHGRVVPYSQPVMRS